MDFCPGGYISLGVNRYILTKRDICKKQIKFALSLQITTKNTKKWIVSVWIYQMIHLYTIILERTCPFLNKGCTDAGLLRFVKLSGGRYNSSALYYISLSSDMEVPKQWTQR